MSAPITVTRLQSRKNDIGAMRLARREEPVLAADGEAVLALDRFALTANNVTYAAFGDAEGLNYWDFFPAGEAEWGHMPVWGFADVVSSQVAGVAAGERFYGYFPIASHLRMKPVRVGERGFYDGSEHRQSLVSAYNQYQRCTTDAAWRADREDLQMLYRPLFITSFMLADFLADNDFFGAERLVFSSASAKTAYGAAWCLAERASAGRVALTSVANLGYVEGLGCYDASLPYERVAEIEPGPATVYVDFSGRPDLREGLRTHLGNRLIKEVNVGATGSADLAALAPRQDGRGVFFFAPNQIRKRNADWGAAEVTRRFNAAQERFLAHVEAAGPAWLTIEEGRGFDAARAAIATLVAGRSDPALGHVVRLGG